MFSFAIAINFGELFHDFLFFFLIFRSANNSRIAVLIINIIWGKSISRATLDKLIDNKLVRGKKNLSKVVTLLVWERQLSLLDRVATD